MQKLFRSKSEDDDQTNVRYRKYIPHVCVVFVCVALIVVGLIIIFAGKAEDDSAGDEYAHLREIFANSPGSQGQHAGDEIDDPGNQDAHDEDADSLGLLPIEELIKMNEDFIGWISIKGHIEYPVVRGLDNDKYIYTTFSGESNKAGAIFMDYRNEGGFDDHITILFGHRMRNGTMFAPLVNYINRSFLQENQIINITTRDGEILTYKIFAAKKTDAWDAFYEIGFSGNTPPASLFPDAPENASRFLLLSTCTASDDRNERILVFAYLDD